MPGSLIATLLGGGTLFVLLFSGITAFGFITYGAGRSAEKIEHMEAVRETVGIINKCESLLIGGKICNEETLD